LLLSDLKLFAPELVVAGLLLGVLILALKPRSWGFYASTCLAGLALALVALAALAALPAQSYFSSMVVHDPFALFCRAFFLAATMLAILLTLRSRELCGPGAGEFYLLLLAVLLGMMLLAGSNHLLMVYLSLELVSVPSYLLAGFLKRERASSEASLKYVIYGALSTGVMLYGLSLLYGLTGSGSFEALRGHFSGSSFDPGLVGLALVMALAGFGYKISSAPFHFWAPDVYEGAPTAFTAFLSVGPKAAGFAVLVRFLFSSLTSQPGPTGMLLPLSPWPTLIAILAALTMFVGNIAALVQHNMKRLLAYSSIAHAGYMLMAVCLVSVTGLQALLFYFIAYAIMNLGVFLVVIVIANATGSEEIATYQGLWVRAPYLVAAMGLFLLSLAGIPPLVGFVGKFYLFKAAIGGQLYWLAVVAVINSAISLYYYVYVLRVMFIDPGGELTPLRPPVVHTAVLAVLVVLTVALGIFYGPLDSITRASAHLLGS
jgi:NADH-quinone oxidoreductase subunit N